MKRQKYDPRLERQKQILAEMKEDKSMRPKRDIFGVRISLDQGQSWQVVAVCDKCFSQIEPPTRAAKEAISGVGACDWCGAVNKRI